MKFLLTVMAGGAIGAGARHLLGTFLLARLGPGFPWWTLTANLSGGLLMGLLMGILARTGGSEEVRLFLGVGVLGGFTTFSAFSLETWMMLERGAMTTALAYVLMSVIGSVLMLGVGLLLTRSIA